MISAVQIQGLDLPHIYNVLQWLVKMLLETRDERNIFNKKLAKSYYSVKMNTKETKPKENNSLLNTIKYNYINTGRSFRQSKDAKFDYNDPIRIYFTLIEYGMNKDLSFQRTLIDLLKKKNLIENDPKDRRSTVTTNTKEEIIKAGAQKETKEIAISNDEKNKLEEIILTNVQEVSSQNRKFQKVNTSVIEEIFNDNIESIINEIDKFENLKEDENVDKIKLFVKEKERLENNKSNIIYQINEYETEYKQMEFNIKNLENEVHQSEDQIKKLNQNYAESENNLVRLNQKIKEAKISEEKMSRIGEKIKTKEELKINISKFKKDCLEEKKIYDNQLEALEKKIQKMSDSQNTQVFDEIDKNYQFEYDKLLTKKKNLFEQNKIINLLTRKIQVFPSKLELIQYQKRFQELYDQINSVSENSKNILNELNSKEEVKKLLNQKLEVFVQLKDAYKNCKTKKDKENFKENLAQIIDSLNESQKRSNEKLKLLGKNIEENNQKLNELQMYENKYMKLIKEYNKEYNKFNRVYN